MLMLLEHTVPIYTLTTSPPFFSWRRMVSTSAWTAISQHLSWEVVYVSEI